MSGITRLSGTACPLGRANIDTDAIIAAEHLKTTAREGLGVHALAALRAEPGSPLADPRYAGAPILIAGENFGCGSSREHAAWALADAGFRAVIAPSFADIFASNAFKNGIMTVALPAEAVARLMAIAAEAPVTIDLETMTVTTPFQHRFAFTLDPFRRESLMTGLDEIALTLREEAAIATFETRRAA